MKKLFLLPIIAILITVAIKVKGAETPEPPPTPGIPSPPLLDVTKEQRPEVTDQTKDVPMPLPAIYVLDSTLNNDGTTVTGTITVKNAQKEGIGGLRYQVLLLGKQPEVKANQIVFDVAPEFDYFISTEEFYLGGGEEKKVNYSYKLPIVPAGDYRLRLQVITSKGWELGWKDMDLKIADSNTTFASLIPSGIVVVNTKEHASPDAGVNVDAGAELQLNFDVRNPGKKAATFTPTLAIYEFYRNRTLLTGDTSEKQQPIVVPAGGKKSVSLTVKALEKPESYYGELYVLNDSGQKASNILPFRWVVKGVSAEITVTKVEKAAYRSGEVMSVVAEIIGSADRQTQSEVTVEATVSDEKGEAGKQTTDAINLGRSARVVRLRVPLSRAITTPVVRVRILDSQKKVLDEDSLSLPKLSVADTVASTVPPTSSGQPEKNPGKFGIYVGLGAAVLIIIVVVALWLQSRRKTDKDLTLMTLLLLIGIFGIAFRVQAVRYVVVDWFMGGPGWEKFEVFCYGAYERPDWCGTSAQRYFSNSPVFGGTYSTVSNPNDPNSPYVIPVSGYVILTACRNSITDAKMFAMTSAVPIWREWGSWYFSQDCGGPHAVCWTTRNITGQITYPRSTTSAWFAIWVDEWLKEGRSDWRNWRSFLRLDFTLASANVDFKVNGSDGPVTVPATGSEVSVNPTWTAHDVTGCTAQSTPASGWTGTKSATGGSETLNLGSSTNYTLTLTCTKVGGGTVTDSVAVNVGAPNPSLTFTASPNPVIYNGSTTLTWTPQFATSCAASGAWTGTKNATGGSETISNLTTNKTFTLTCQGGTGTTPVTRTVDVTVNAPQAPQITLKANNKTSPVSVYSSDDVTLTWEIAGYATSCSASGDWTGTKDVTGGNTFLGKLPVGVKRYTLSCSGPSGTDTETMQITSSLKTLDPGEVREL